MADNDWMPIIENGTFHHLPGMDNASVQAPYMSSMYPNYLIFRGRKLSRPALFYDSEGKELRMGN
jgi:hypothetical protein